MPRMVTMTEMLTDGTLCDGCGAYLGDGAGFTRWCCRTCAESRGNLDALIDAACAQTGGGKRAGNRRLRFTQRSGR